LCVCRIHLVKSLISKCIHLVKIAFYYTTLFRTSEFYFLRINIDHILINVIIWLLSIKIPPTTSLRIKIQYFNGIKKLILKKVKNGIQWISTIGPSFVNAFVYNLIKRFFLLTLLIINNIQITLFTNIISCNCWTIIVLNW